MKDRVLVTDDHVTLSSLIVKGLVRIADKRSVLVDLNAGPPLPRNSRITSRVRKLQVTWHRQVYRP